jgi:integrase/recombinase XerD
MRDPSRVRVSGPLEAFAAGFVAELERVGYSPLGATLQLRLMARLSRWLASEGLGPAGLTEDVVERFLAGRRAAGDRDYVTARATAPLLRYLRGLGVAPSPLPSVPVGATEALLERFGAYLALERGVTAETVEGYVAAVRPFLAWLGGEGELESRLRGLTAAPVMEFVVARCPRQTRGAAKMTVMPTSAVRQELEVDM